MKTSTCIGSILKHKLLSYRNIYKRDIESVLCWHYMSRTFTTILVSITYTVVESSFHPVCWTFERATYSLIFIVIEHLFIVKYMASFINCQHDLDK